MEDSCCHFMCLFPLLVYTLLNPFSLMNFPFRLLRRHLDKADINTLMKIKVFMFDCDGVLWNGAKPIAGAIETVNYLKDKGKSVFYCVCGLCVAFLFRRIVRLEAGKILWRD